MVAEGGEKTVAPPLYGRMMRAIRTGHSIGNTIRMLKLPLVFTEQELYFGAIAQFYLLTEALEEALERSKGTSDMVARVAALGLRCAPGYESDLEELGGAEWRERARRSQTAATSSYCKILQEASDPVELTAAAFILYGALVVGGGKSTQAKVRKIFPNCAHKLFDVSEDMKTLRADFKRTFTNIGKEFPGDFERLEGQAARFMALNNTVVLSIRCWGRVATAAATATAAVIAGAAIAYSRART